MAVMHTFSSKATLYIILQKNFVSFKFISNYKIPSQTKIAYVCVK